MDLSIEFTYFGWQQLMHLYNDLKLLLEAWRQGLPPIDTLLFHVGFYEFLQFLIGPETLLQIRELDSLGLIVQLGVNPSS